MTAASLFDTWSRAQGSPADTRARILACLNRELHFRRKVFPKRVAAHKMSEAEAAYQLRVIEAIHEDYTWRPGDERLYGDIGHAEKVKALKRELGYRQAVFPAKVQAATLGATDAEAETAAIAAILDHYETWLFGFTGGRDQVRTILAQRTPAPDLLGSAAA